MKRWIAGLCSCLLLFSPEMAWAADWAEVLRIRPDLALFIDKSSLRRENETVYYWGKVNLVEDNKPQKLREWEKKHQVTVSEYKVQVIENCRTRTYQQQNLILIDKNGMPIPGDQMEMMSLFNWPTQVIPDTSLEVEHEFVCGPNSPVMAVAQPIAPATPPQNAPKDSYQNSDDPLWNRPSYQKKVAAVGRRILDANGITQPVGFVVSNHEAANASGSDRQGEVNIHSGLLKYIDNDDELAGVLAHEIVHVLERHESRTVNKAQIWSSILYATTTILTQKTGDPYLDRYNDRVNQLEANQFGQLAVKGYSQKMETEADLIGLDLMVRAGYNPIALFTAFRKVMGDSSLPRAYRSHPNPSERLALIRKNIEAKYPEYLPENERPVDTTAAAQQAATPPSILKDEDVEALRRIQAEGRVPQSGSNPPATGTSK